MTAAAILGRRGHLEGYPWRALRLYLVGVLNCFRVEEGRCRGDTMQCRLVSSIAEAEWSGRVREPAQRAIGGGGNDGKLAGWLPLLAVQRAREGSGGGWMESWGELVLVLGLAGAEGDLVACLQGGRALRKLFYGGRKLQAQKWRGAVILREGTKGVPRWSTPLGADEL
jgi:hypothetical protein